MILEYIFLPRDSDSDSESEMSTWEDVTMNRAISLSPSMTMMRPWLLHRVLRVAPTPLISAPMSTVASKISQLSITFPPIFATSKLDIDPFISSRKNILSIDLDEAQNHAWPIQASKKFPNQVREDFTSNSVRQELEMFKASQGPVHFHGYPREDLERNTLLIHRIRKIVSEDAAKEPEDRIDCIEIGPEPWPEYLRALDGLSPKHLRVDAGPLEEINVFELDEINTKFELESLTISGVLCDWSESSFTDPTPDHRFPEFFTHVKSLTLEYCYGIRFEGTNLPVNLRQLKIIGNNAMDMFIFAVDNLPNLKATKQLERVFIYTDPQLDMSYEFWLYDFRERLGMCKGLKELTLIIADDYEARAARYANLAAQYPRAPGEPEGENGSDPFDVGLSRSLPNSIERLEFHCSNSEPMLADLDLWIEAAKDPEWLPRLEYIHIRTYDVETDNLRIRLQTDKPRTVVDTGRDRMFSEKIWRVYEILKSRSPPVEVGR